MKTGIHPEYKTVRVTCACGRVTETRATVDELHVEICSHCHPFFTGRQKLVDTAGRVERFRAKYGEAEDRAERKKKRQARVKAAEASPVPSEDGAATGGTDPALVEAAPVAESESVPEAEAESGATSETESQATPEAEAATQGTEDPAAEVAG